MSRIDLQYEARPSTLLAMFKALVFPRKGFDSELGLPEINAHWHQAQVDPIALSDYLTLLKIEAGDCLPIVYPHVLAGTMHMNMLSHRLFPIRLLGALHLKNRIIQHRPIGPEELVDIDAGFGDYRLVEKGVEFDLITTLSVAGNRVWQEISIFFVRGRFGGEENPSLDSSFDLPVLTETQVAHRWHIPNNLGRRYASISGDYNPIHISSIAAKLFGFERDIAHGFGTLAQAINYCNVGSESTPDGVSTQVDVIFKGPVFLGSDVCIRHKPAQSAARFDVYCDGNPRPSLCVAISKLAA